MASGAISTSGIVPKVLVLSALIASALVLIINRVSVKVVVSDLSVNSDGTKLTFKDVVAYRYMLYTTIIGATYVLLQLPFVLYHLRSGKRVAFTNFLPDFDFYGDQVITFLLLTSVSASLGVSFELKSLANNFFKAIADPSMPEIEESRASYSKFLNRGIVATAVLSFGVICMGTTLIISSIHRSTRKGYVFG